MITRSDDNMQMIQADGLEPLPLFMALRDDGTVDYWKTMQKSHPTSEYASGELRGVEFIEWLVAVEMAGSAALRRFV